MEKFILIDGEKFYYTEVKLFHGRKIINREISKVNLELFHSVIEGEDVRYGLMYGTLLGAIREQNFIEHDEDIDLYLLEEDREKFLRLLPEFKEKGLELIRVQYNGDLISLMRDDEYIDIYVYKQTTRFGFMKMRISGNAYILKAKYLENSILYDFLGMKIPIPSQPRKVLELLYGPTWETPIKNSHAPKNTFYAWVGARFPNLKKIPLLPSIIKMYKRYF